MLKANIDFIPQIFNDYAEAYAQALNEVAMSAGDAAYNAVEAPLLNELRYTPRKVKYPIEWISERQRKAFFATNGFGGGIPYRRTGRAKNSWYVKNATTKNGYRLSVGSTWDGAQFVYGTLNFRSTREALRPMQKFHRNTGWVPVSETVAFWIDAMEETFEKEFRNGISTYKIKRRSRR